MKKTADDQVEEACTAVKEAFEIDSDSLAAEISVFFKKQLQKDDGKLISKLVLQFKAKNVHNGNVFPNMLKVLQLFLTVSVSTASAEPSFSVLKRVKNCLRNTMVQNRLSNWTSREDQF